MGLVDSVRAGLAELEPLDVRDRAVADLALAYAEALDDARDWLERQHEGAEDVDSAWRDRQRDPLAELGPKLLAALTALGMTPAARKGIVSDKSAGAPKASPLDELRKKREARGAS